MACSEMPALVMVRGTKGMGKSTLGVQIARHAQVQGATVVWVTPSPRHPKLWPAIRAALEATGLVQLGELPDELPGHDASQNWTGIRQLVKRVTRLVIIFDGYDRSLIYGRDDRLLTALDALLGVHLVLLGSEMGALDEPLARTRLPAVLIEDEHLRFTRAETKQLLELAGVSADVLTSRAAQALELTDGWPLALQAILVGLRAAPGSAPRLDELFATGFIESSLGGVPEELYDAALISGVVEEMSSGLLSEMAEVPEQHAAQILRVLARTVLRQRFGSDGSRRYSLQRVLRGPLWRVPRLRDGSQLDQGRRRAAAMALRANHPDEALHAAFTARDWALVSELILHCTTESLIRPGGVLTVALNEIPTAVQERFPLLRFCAMLPAYAAPRGRRSAVTSRLREIAEAIDGTKAQHGPMYRLAATAATLFSARVTGDETRVKAALETVEQQFDLLEENDIRRSWPTIATIANHVALTYLMFDDFDASERWTYTGTSIAPARPPKEHPVGRVHADAISAFVAAWRGDMRVAGERVDAWERAHSLEQWGSHFVATPYLLAKAIVLLELGESESALERWRMLNERVRSSDARPYVMWLGVQVSLARYSTSRAAGDLRRSMRSLQQTTRLLRPQQHMLDALVAQLMVTGGLGHPGPTNDPSPTLVDAYAALDAGEFAGAAAISTSVHKTVSKQGNVRKEIESLLLREAAEVLLQGSGEEAHNPANTTVEGDHARKLVQDFGVWVTGTIGTSGSIQEYLTARLVQAPVDADVGADGLEHATEPSTGSGRIISSPADGRGVPRAILRPLTKAEVRALQAVAVQGNAVRAAEAMQLSPHTVRDHLKSVYRKLEVNSRSEAVRVAYLLGLIE